jgi:hypothetical protein
MTQDWTGKKRCEEALLEKAGRKLFPIPRHQVIPSAVQGATNSGNGGDKQVNFACFNSPHASRIYVHKFSQSLLGHPQGSADTANVPAKFPQISGDFSLNHPILREAFMVDLKGVMRPNRCGRPVFGFWEGKVGQEKRTSFYQIGTGRPLTPNTENEMLKN